jgi:enoyl-CoA hydratase/carnithine racemase
MIDIARAMKIGLVDAVGDSEAAVEWAKSMITNSQGAIAVVSFTPDK